MYFRKPRSFDPLASQRYADQWTPGLGTVMYHGAKTSFETSTLALGYNLLRNRIAKKTGDAMDENTWRASKWYRPGLEYEEEMTEDFAKVLAERYDNTKASNLVYERTGALGATLFWGSALAGALPDPINIIPFMRFIPGGSASRTLMAQNALGRVGIGAVEGGLGAAALQPLLAAERLSHQEEYDRRMGAIDVLVGIGAGTVLSGVMEGGRRSLVKYKSNSKGTLSPTTTSRVQRNLNRFSIETQTRYARKGIMAVQEGKVVDVLDKTTTDQTPPHTPPPVTVEGVGTLRTDLGPIETKFEFIEADDVVTSHLDEGDRLVENKTNYPSELQPRERGTLESLAQVKQIAGAKFDPLGMIDADRTGKVGAPVIGPDNLVESGNGRILALKRVNNDANAKTASYRDLMKHWATYYKLDPKQVDGMKNPILVRRRTTDLTPESRVRFTQRSNVSDVSAMRDSETAMQDATLIESEDLALLQEGDVFLEKNADFRQTIFNKFPEEQRLALTKDGEISDPGKKRIQNALLAKAYGDKRIIDNLVDFGSGEYQKIANSLHHVSNVWASMRADIDRGNLHANYDPTPHLVEAVFQASGARRSGIVLKDMVKEMSTQHSLDPEFDLHANTMVFLDFLANATSQKKIVAGLSSYVDALRALGTPKQAGMFDVELPSMEQLIDQSLGAHRTEAKVEARVQEETPKGPPDEAKIREEVEAEQVNARDEEIDFRAREEEVFEPSDDYIPDREPTDAELKADEETIDEMLAQESLSKEELEEIIQLERETAYYDQMADAVDEGSPMMDCLIPKL